MKYYLLALLLLPLNLLAEVSSTTGTILFDSDFDTNAEMTLNSTGLGIGIAPLSNLHVDGNAIISKQLFVGGNSGSSNLNINGTLGFAIESVSSNTTLGNSSLVLANAASDNIELTLPNAALVSGQIITIKKINIDNRVTISSNTLIDNRPGLSLGAGYNSISLISNGTQWFETSSYGSNISNDLTSFSSNCLMWFDGDDASSVTVDGNGNITQWSDKSGNDYHSTRSTNRHPTYTAAAINGRGAIDFTRDDFQYLLTSTTVPIRGDMTFFVVAEMKSGGSNDASTQMLSWDGTSDGGSNRLYEFSA